MGIHLMVEMSHTLASFLKRDRDDTYTVCWMGRKGLSGSVVGAMKIGVIDITSQQTYVPLDYMVDAYE
jgi:hypothetical protein